MEEREGTAPEIPCERYLARAFLPYHVSSRATVVADCGTLEPEFKAASFILTKALPCGVPSIRKHRVMKPTWTTSDHLKWYHREQTNGRKGAKADGWVYPLAHAIHMVLHFGNCENAVANHNIRLENKKRKEMGGGGITPKKLKREKVVKKDEFMLAANYMHWANNLTKSCAKPKDEEDVEDMAARLDAWDRKLGIVTVPGQVEEETEEETGSEDGKEADSPRPGLMAPHTTQDLEDECKCIEAFLTQANESFTK